MSQIKVWRTPPGIPPAVIALLGSERNWQASDLRCATLSAQQPVAARIMDCGYDERTDTLILGFSYTQAPILEKFLTESAADFHEGLEDLPIWDKTPHVKWADATTSIG